MSEPTHHSLRDLRKTNKGPSKGYTGPKVAWSGARKYEEPEVPAPAVPYSGSQAQVHTSGYREPVNHNQTQNQNQNRNQSYSSTRPVSAQSSYSSNKTPPAEPAQSSWFSWGKTAEPTTTSSTPTTKTMPSRPPPGRYIPPSEREPGQAGFAMKKKATGGTHGRLARGSMEDSEDEEEDNSWSGWAARQQRQASAVITGAAVTVGDTVQGGWDSVNDAQKRDKVVGGIGGGAAKVAGGAIKYSAKGVWAVGKAAFR